MNKHTLNKALAVLRDKGLVELSAKDVVVQEVPVKLKRAFCWLSDKGVKMLELSGSVDADLLNVTPKQLELLRLLKGGKKPLAEIPKRFHPSIKNVVNKGLVEKRVEEEETKREVYGKRLVCTITEKGAKAYKALKTLQSL